MGRCCSALKELGEIRVVVFERFERSSELLYSFLVLPKGLYSLASHRDL